MVARGINRRNTLNGLRSEVDRLFDHFFVDHPGVAARQTSAYPALNIWEDEDHLFFEAELPGVRMEDIELLVDGEELQIKGSRGEQDVGDATYHRRERGVGGFCRRVHLPFAVDGDRVSATLRDGVLLITLPKAAEVKPRRIEVKAG